MKKKRFVLLATFVLSCSALFFFSGCHKDSEEISLKLVTSKDTRTGSVVAYSGGTVTAAANETITMRGTCWSVNRNPTVKDNKTKDGSGSGTFESILSDLTPNTTYFVRIYAIQDGKQLYGDEVSFRTNDIVTDIDGNVYNTVTIGQQVWTVENLRTTRYQNGDVIPTTVPVSRDIRFEVNPKYQWAYKGDESTVKQFGRLYTWYAATDKRNICPAGWHVPSEEEWKTLEKFLIDNGFNFDGSTELNNVGKSLASASGWEFSSLRGAVGNSEFAESANKTGFTAVPGGYRYNEGQFSNLGSAGHWWSSIDKGSYLANTRYIFYNRSDLIPSNLFEFCGASVRCIKD